MLRAGEVTGAGVSPDAVFRAGGMPVAAKSDAGLASSPGVFRDLGVVPVTGCETVEEVLKYCSCDTGLPKGVPDQREAGIKEVTDQQDLTGHTEAPSSAAPAL